MPAMPRTEVMLLSGVGFGNIGPSWRTNFLNPHRTTPQEPQNLLRQTIQGATLGGVGLGDVVLNDTQLMYLGIGQIVAAGLFGAVSAIHGYRRNHNSVGWGWTWGIFGAALPGLAIPVALIEGFGKPGKK